MKNLINLFLSLLLVLSGNPAAAQFSAPQAQNLDKNYILNGGYENGKAGWVSYKDAAGALPIDGTAGAPSLTIAASTSTPISDKSSGLLTKATGNLQGEGISYDFTIDKNARGKVLTISGSYEIVSGTYQGGTSTTDSDVVVYLFDKDAGKIIQPAGYKLDGGVIGNTYPILATFQPDTTSTNFRLIFHNAISTTTAFQLRMDQIKIGLQQKSQGPPVTDWATYTNVCSGSYTGTYTCKSRRVGDMKEYDIYLSITSVSGVLIVNIPDTIDGAKISGGGSVNTDFGLATVLDVGNNLYTSRVSYNNTTSVVVDLNTSSGSFTTPNGLSTTALATLGSGDAVHLNFKLPIVGLGSTTTMSDSADTRVVAVEAIGAATTITSAWTQLAIGAASGDTHGMIVGNTVVVPAPGWYDISALAATNAASSYLANHRFSVGYSINNASVQRAFNGEFRATATATAQPLAGGAALRLLNGGDVIRFFAINDPASVALAASASYFSVSRRSGPSQIAASESVGASYQTSAGQSIPNGTEATVVFATKISDSYGMVNTSNGDIKIPISGEYFIESTLKYAGNSAGVRFAGIRINGSAGRFTQNQPGSNAGIDHNQSVSYRGRFLAGDIVNIRASQSSGGSLSLAADGVYNQFSITRVGN